MVRAEALRTALAEKAYWRLRFLMDSPGTPQLKPVAHTAFSAPLRTRAALDLTRAPFVRERARSVHPGDYHDTQALGTAARAAHLEAIRYESVRDAQGGVCVAVLEPGAFRRAAPRALSTWFIAASRERVRATTARDATGGYEFAAAQVLAGREAAAPGARESATGCARP